MLLLKKHYRKVALYVYSDQAVGWKGQTLIFLILQTPNSILGSSQAHIQCVLAVMSSGVKWPVCEADYSCPLNAETKNDWSYMCAAPVCLNGCTGQP
jgi:hypothetical protein